MKKFSFRLQKLLRLEGQREDQARIKLHSLLSDLHGQEKILKFLEDSLSQNQEDLSAGKGVGTDSQKLMLYHNYIVALNERIEYQTKKVNEVIVEVNNGRNDLLVIQKDRKILEKLRDKHRNEYNDYKRKTEMKQLDDMALRKPS